MVVALSGVRTYRPITLQAQALQAQSPNVDTGPGPGQGLFGLRQIAQKMMGRVDEGTARAYLANAPVAIERAADAISSGAPNAQAAAKLKQAGKALNDATSDGVLRFASDTDIEEIAHALDKLSGVEIAGDGRIAKECATSLAQIKSKSAEFAPRSDWVSGLDQIHAALPSSTMPKTGMEWNPSRDTWHAAGDETNFHNAHDMTVPRKIDESDDQYMQRLAQRALSKLPLTDKAEAVTAQYVEDYATHARLSDDAPDATGIAERMNQAWDDFRAQTGRDIPHWEPPLPPSLAQVRDEYVDTVVAMRTEARTESERAPYRETLQRLDAQMTAGGRTMRQHHMPFE